MPKPITDNFPSVDVRRLHRAGGLEIGAGEVSITHQDEAVTLPLTWTACAKGGARPWFACPACARRAALLYRSGARWACRKCLGLVYASQGEDRLQRAVRRRDNVIAKMREDADEGRGSWALTNRRLAELRAACDDVKRETAASLAGVWADLGALARKMGR